MRLHLNNRFLFLGKTYVFPKNKKEYQKTGPRPISKSAHPTKTNSTVAFFEKEEEEVALTSSSHRD
jgi:hypothetical protein